MFGALFNVTPSPPQQFGAQSGTLTFGPTLSFGPGSGGTGNTGLISFGPLPGDTSGGGTFLSPTVASYQSLTSPNAPATPGTLGPYGERGEAYAPLDIPVGRFMGRFQSLDPLPEDGGSGLSAIPAWVWIVGAIYLLTRK